MSTKPIARYYRGARTAHLERLHESTPGDFFYQKPMYDFDVSRAPASSRVERTTFLRVTALVLGGKYSTLEIVEPYAPSALPQNLVLSLAARFGRLIRREPTRLVAYAIENADLPTTVAASTRLPVAVTRPLLRLTVGFCYRSLSRVVFGTADARDNYVDLLGNRPDRAHPATTLIWGLPQARLDTPVGHGHDAEPAADRRVAFVGAFDDRKGVRQLMDSWTAVLDAEPGAQLHIVGKGEHEGSILTWAAAATNVTVTVDPSREVIWEAYDRSDVLVLLSQPSANWKEQIGLPIIEGLSSGVEIVASTETGIARWLADHGHRVLPPDVSRTELADVVVDALRTRRTRRSIQSSLPAVDGRLAADQWLFASDQGGTDRIGAR